MSSALILTGATPAFSSDSAAGEAFPISTALDLGAVSSLVNPAPVGATSAATVAATQASSITTASVAPKVRWGSRLWIPSFDTLTSKELSVLQKSVFPYIVRMAYTASSVRCIGLHNKQISSSIARARALATCLELVKVHPHLTYEVLVKRTTARLDRSVYVHVGTISYANSSDLSNRNFDNKADALSGLQIKAIYLLPKDAPDLKKDINGTISRYLDEGNAFISSSTGKSLKIDRDQKGNYDIGFIQSSYTEKELLDFSEVSDMSWLDDGTNFQSTDPKNAGKIFMFFLESDTSVRSYCGLAVVNGAAFVSASGSCADGHREFKSYSSLIWVHEFMHQIGVGHNDDPCDFMYGSNLGESAGLVACSFVTKRKADPENKYYINSSASGLDIMKSDLWLPATNR